MTKPPLGETLAAALAILGRDEPGIFDDEWQAEDAAGRVPAGRVLPVLITWNPADAR